MIAGVILVGPSDATVLVRGIGPSLAKEGVSSPLANPVLDLYDGNGQIIQSNNDWQDTQETLIESSGLAPTNSLESAIDVTLAPGAYTAILSGAKTSRAWAWLKFITCPKCKCISPTRGAEPTQVVFMLKT